MSGIAGTYDRVLAHDQTAMRLLASADEHLAQYVPVTHIVKGSTGVGGLPFVPWVAVLDPDETESAQRGIYVVYLFSADGTKLYLSLNQGTDDLKNPRRMPERPRGSRSIPQQLRAQAEALRNHLQLRSHSGLLDEIDLRAPRDKQRPRNYEAANIVARVYDTGDLPNDGQLRDDLTEFLELYGQALEVRDQLKIAEPDVISSRQRYRPPPMGTFKPTDGNDYLVKVIEREERRSRKHVPLLTAFAQRLLEHGFTPSNQGIHPRDLIATKDGQQWLVEVKVVHRGNGQHAAREAVAQLLEYRRFCYSPSERSEVRMLAVFNESIGSAFVDHLESLGIASVWTQGRRWVGSTTANTKGIC